ncbi:hypothetical protein ABZ543_13395 [Streptomyces roseifaciens]
MGRDLIQTTFCDWCAEVGQHGVDATETRALPNNDEIDVCAVCAIVWDFVGGRLDFIRRRIDPEVIDGLMRSGHRIAPVEPAPQPKALPPAAAPAALPAQKQKYKPGEWRPDEAQVVCPLEHRAGSPSPYWVLIGDRGGHARNHDKTAPEVGFRPQPGLELQFVCTDHKICANNGGFPFHTAQALRTHGIKCKDWEKAPQESVVG